MVVPELQKGEPQCANTEVPSVTHVMMSSWAKQIIQQSGSDGKESTCNAGDPSLIPGSGRSAGEGLATHSSILAQRIPWTA